MLHLMVVMHGLRFRILSNHSKATSNRLYQLTAIHTGGSVVGGWFTLSFDGTSTNNLRFDVSSSKLQEELEKLGTTGKLHVTRKDNFGIINAYQWNVIFLEYLGNVPLISVRNHLSCSNGSINTDVHVTERISGILPRMNSIHFDQIELKEGDFRDEKEIRYTIGDLHEGIGYHVRVSTWNGVGNMYGPSKYSLPAIAFPMDSPSPPSNLLATPISKAEVEVSWKSPLNFAGATVKSYKVEWLTRSGVFEAQKICIGASSTVYDSLRYILMGLQPTQ